MRNACILQSTKNHKIFLYKLKEDLYKWREIACSKIGEFYFMMQILPKVIYKFNEIPIKIYMTF